MSEDYGFALPGFEDHEATDTGVVGHAGPVYEPQGDDEDLWSVNHEDDEQTIKDSLPPQGWYTVQLQASPRTVKEVEGVRLPDQRYFGIGSLEKDGKVYKTRIRTSLCSKKFVKANGRTHWAYLQYVSAGKAFLAANDRKHDNYDELEQYLTENPVDVYVGHTQDNDTIAKEFRRSRAEIPF